MPKGLYRTVEDSERDIEDNTPDEGDIQMPPTDVMVKPENWVHYSQNILKVGRTSHMDPEPPQDDEGEFD